MGFMPARQAAARAAPGAGYRDQPLGFKVVFRAAHRSSSESPRRWQGRWRLLTCRPVRQCACASIVYGLGGRLG